MTRRTLFSALAGMLSSAGLDPERLLWIPGKKLISIPAQSVMDQWKLDLAFYNGDQWPAEIRREREAAGRPCIMFNRIANIVTALEFERNIRPLTPFGRNPEWRALVSEVVRKHRDNQMLYNFYASATAEAVAALERDRSGLSTFRSMAEKLAQLERVMSAGVLTRIPGLA